MALKCIPLVALLIAPALFAQEDWRLESRALHSNVIVPQSRVFTPEQTPVQITGVSVSVEILDQAATTSYVIKLHNPGTAMAEGEMILPVPQGSVLTKFDFAGAGTEPSAQLLPREEALKIYNEIVRRYRDPALMQFVGLNLIRTSVFPVEAGGDQEIRFTYEHVLAAVGNRVDYELPRSEVLAYDLPWDISVSIKSNTAISTVYSPSHTTSVARHGDSHVCAEVDASSKRDPGPFRLSYMLAGDGVAASLFAYPDPSIGGGYFLVVAGLPAKLPVEHAIKREVTLVIDRSGSMNGDKWKQAKEAAIQIIAGLGADEAFNLIAYNGSVDVLFKQPVLHTDDTEQSARDFLDRMRPAGGTNIHDALVEALIGKPLEGKLPMVLFLTDGLATVGQTSEVTIRDLAGKYNEHNRRIFTFGVGLDVNAPMLENIADATRASSTFVLPGEDVEVKVGDVFNRLKGPVLASPTLDVPREANGATRVTELIPGAMPDLFEGDQLVLLGKYAGSDPLEFKLTGNYLGEQRSFNFRFALDNATTRNSFVSRLWASRKVGMLVDTIRQAGADTTTPISMTARFQEIVDEIVKLSTQFGILTEYTAFLALEGTDLGKKAEVREEAWGNLQRRGMQTRSGAGAINQSENGNEMKRQYKENKRNEWLDEKLDRVAVGEVQQLNDRNYFKRAGRWVDARLLEKADIKPARTIVAGSDEYLALIKTLAEEGRAGAVAVEGEILLQVGDEIILITPAK
jgi:Ca-activated chloride channel family protein